jgi:hypothetical protein
MMIGQHIVDLDLQAPLIECVRAYDEAFRGVEDHPLGSHPTSAHVTTLPTSITSQAFSS